LDYPEIVGYMSGQRAVVRVTAKIEGLPGEWQALEGNVLKQFMNDRQPVTRDPEEWRALLPDSKRDIPGQNSTSGDIDF
jgi:hypothetical protein